MLKRQNLKKEKKVKVTFVVPADKVSAEDESISVVGCFNDWDPEATPLKKRSNGTLSAAVKFDPNKRYEFRYYHSNGSWLNEEDADAFEPSGHDSTNCILLT